MLSITSNIPTLDRTATAEAADLLGLTRPIHIHGDKRLRGADYAGLLVREDVRAPGCLTGRRHVIRYNPPAFRAASARTAMLWHELTHALQCERDFGGNWLRFFDTYNADLRTVQAATVRHTRSQGVIDRYRNVKWEREAIETADVMAGDFPLFLDTDPWGR